MALKSYLQIHFSLFHIFLSIIHFSLIDRNTVLTDNPLVYLINLIYNFSHNRLLLGLGF
jgi:hypothetical protein